MFNSAAVFNDETLSLIKNARPGDKIILCNVTIEDALGKVFKIKPAEFEVTD